MKCSDAMDFGKKRITLTSDFLCCQLNAVYHLRKITHLKESILSSSALACTRRALSTSSALARLSRLVCNSSDLIVVRARTANPPLGLFQ